MSKARDWQSEGLLCAAREDLSVDFLAQICPITAKALADSEQPTRALQGQSYAPRRTQSEADTGDRQRTCDQTAGARVKAAQGRAPVRGAPHAAYEARSGDLVCWRPITRYRRLLTPSTRVLSLMARRS